MSSSSGGRSKKDNKGKESDGQPTHKELKELRKRVELCQREASYKDEVMRLQDAIMRAEQESWKIKEEVEKFKNTRDFDWQLERYAVVRKLTAQIAVDQEDLIFAKDKYEILHKEVMDKYPELANDFLKPQEVPPEELAEAELEQDFSHIDLAGTGADTGPVASNISFGDSASEVVYSWMIGKLSPDDKISTVLFGQFTKSKLPPKDGWVFVGRNLDRNVVAISKAQTQAEKDAAAAADVAAFDSLMSPKASLSDSETHGQGHFSFDGAEGGSSLLEAPASVGDVPPPAGTSSSDAAVKESNSNSFKRIKLLPESVLEQARGDSLKVALHTHLVAAPVVSPGQTMQVADTLQGAAAALAAIPEEGVGMPMDIVPLGETAGIRSEFAPPDSAVAVPIYPRSSVNASMSGVQSPLRSGAMSPTLSVNTDPSTYVYYVSGCSLDMLNGRYLPQGSMFNAPK
jgi:hypothetical protein